MTADRDAAIAAAVEALKGYTNGVEWGANIAHEAAAHVYDAEVAPLRAEVEDALKVIEPYRGHPKLSGSLAEILERMLDRLIDRGRIHPLFKAEYERQKASLDEARALLREARSEDPEKPNWMMDGIAKALNEFRLWEVSLADCLSAPGDGTIKTGKQQIEGLADAIWIELTDRIDALLGEEAR